MTEKQPGVRRWATDTVRRQTEGVVIRFTEEEKARINRVIPKGQVAPTIRRLLLDHLAKEKEQQ